MFVRELADDGQPKAASASSVAACRFQAVEWLKYGLRLVCGNAGPAIAKNPAGREEALP